MKGVSSLGMAMVQFCLWGLWWGPPAGAEPSPGDVGEVGCGSLQVVRPDGRVIGLCPLKHTEVQVEIAGFIARVNVRQRFHNPYEDKIEAVYTFPLSQDAAVDDMTMMVGDRVIRGLIKERSEAREIYEQAKRAGHVAGLLDQERPNIFTQSVANIEPGVEVEIRISYVEHLDWEEGVFGFDFPTVVGPRYIPGSPTGRSGTGWSPDTDQVPDAGRITPPVTPPGTRSGHDLSITVNLVAGLPIQRAWSLQHELDIEYADEERTTAVVRLKNLATIPNRDFVLKYRTASDEISDTLLAHTDERGKFFTLVLQPPEHVPPEWIVPKEMIFVIDKSGSMRGFPIETAKQTMRRCIENLNPNDTFNLMTFAGGVGFCFQEPVPNTQENRRRALEYLASLRGSGGTEMMKAIEACLGGQPDPERVRVVCFMTDGYVGNEPAIIEAVQRNAGVARVFSFGIGRSVNRFLLDGMARAGRGEVEYVLSPEQTSEASMRFYQRVSSPVLIDVELEWSGLEVEEVFPRRIPDLFSAKPVVIKGRYATGGYGRVTLRGRRGGEAFARTIELELPVEEPGSEVLASLWARAKVDDLMNRDLLSMQRGREDPGLKERVVDLALSYRLLTRYTSFVAVEETTVTRDGKAVTVTVPVEMPEGVSYEGVFGQGARGESRGLRKSAAFCLSPGIMRERAPTARGASGAVDMYAPRRCGPDRAGVAIGEEMISGRHDQGKSAPPRPLTGEELRRQALQGKLTGGLLELPRLVGRTGAYAQGRIVVEKGRVEVAVYLREATKKNLAELQALGFELLLESKVTEGLVIGTIAVGKLEALALLGAVRRVEPTAWSRLD